MLLATLRYPGGQQMAGIEGCADVIGAVEVVQPPVGLGIGVDQRQRLRQRLPKISGRSPKNTGTQKNSS